MALAVKYLTVDGEVLSETRSGTRKDYVPNPLGSTIALLNSSQTKTDTMSYWPYGEDIKGTSTATPLRFGGTLGYYTDSSSRVYVRARALEPQYGRWLTVDPLWPRTRSYGYASATPASNTDPFGLFDQCKYDKCFYDMLSSNSRITPFGACLKCATQQGMTLPVAENGICSTLPLDRSSIDAILKVIELLKRVDVCNPCNSYTQPNECCVGISCNIGSFLQLTNFKDISGAKIQDCVNRCDSAMKGGHGPDGSPSFSDALRGLAACLGAFDNTPSWLTILKLILQGVSRGAS